MDKSGISPSKKELQRALEKSHHDQKIMSALLQAAQSILQSRKFKESARSIFNSCKKVTGATAGYVALLSSDGAENEVLFLDSGGVACTVDQSLPMPIRGLRAEAYHTGKVVYDNDFSTSKWMQFLPQGHSRLDNVLFAPLLIEEKAVGLFGLANKPTGFTENDAQAAAAFAQVASIGFLNSRHLEALTDSENRFRSVVQTAKDAIITINNRGKISFWNEEAANCFGYGADEIVGRECRLLMPEEYRQAHLEGLSQAVSTGRTKLVGKPLEMKGLRKDGTIFPLELSLAKWETRDDVFFTGVIRDISLRKQAEEELKSSEQRFRELFMNMKGGGAVYQAQENGQDFIFVDHHQPEGLPVISDPDSKIGKSVLEVFPAARDYGLLDVMRRVWETGAAEYHPVAIYNDDNIVAWRENYVYKLPSGEIVTIYEDLTERKQFEEALKEREELFRTIFATSPDAININSMKDGRFLRINEGFTLLTGFTPQDVLGKTGPDIKIWHDPQDRKRLFAMLEKKGQVKNYEATFCLKDGRIMPGLVSARVIQLHNEPHVLAITRDISEMKKMELTRKKYRQELEQHVAERTAELAASNKLLLVQIKERRQVEAALVESEKKYSQLVEASLTGIYISQDGKIAFANERFAAIFGYSRHELLGMDTLQLVHPDNRALVKTIRKKRLQGKDVPQEYEIRGLRKDGETIWVTRRNTLISYEGKKAVLGNVVDITDRKKMERALMRSENELRFLSSQLLSAEERERKRIAHELHDGIGQALTAIKFSVENTVRNLSDLQIDFDSKPLQATVPLIQKTVEEVRRIIMDLRPSTLDDLGILATISWFSREFSTIYSTIAIEKRIAIEEEEIPVSLKTVIFRILQEGLHNAAKYSQAEHILLCLEKMDRRIVLLIEDEGVGFDVETVLAQKNEKQGIGLASMRERALFSGGAFSIKTAPGQGTSICAMWPLESRE